MDEQLKKNLAIWGQQESEIAEILETMIPQGVRIVTHANGDLNLLVEKEDQKLFYHSEESAHEEAKAWFTPLSLKRVGTLFVFGVGLGHYYSAAKEWLHEKKERKLIFLEDDVNVLHALFSSEKGSELLKDKQVQIRFISYVKNRWHHLKEVCEPLLDVPHYVTALDFYRAYRSEMLNKLEIAIGSFAMMREFRIKEYMTQGSSFFSNFYQNLLALPQAHLAQKMKGSCQDLPAIICAAGPSLGKQLPLLETLHSHALIFGAGTAMTILNRHGITPHFGITVDPNFTQYTRVIMNDAFEVPFFYYNRVNHDAFETVQGEKIYIAGSKDYPATKWFEEKLSVDPEGLNIAVGTNVVHLALCMAQWLGCRPILFAGLDLAYTEDASYATGVVPHPLHSQREFKTKFAQEHVMIVEDIYGKPIKTLSRWIEDARLFDLLSKRCPNQAVVNATEGGIGIPNHMNVILEKFAEEFLKKECDLTGKIHSEVQKATMPTTVEKKEIKKLFEELDESFERCLGHCLVLKELFLKEMKRKEQLFYSFSPELMQKLRQLNDEAAFRAVLSIYSNEFLAQRETSLIEQFKTEDPAVFRETFLQFQQNRYEQLKEVVLFNRKKIQEALNTVSDQPVQVKHPPEFQLDTGDCYLFDQAQFQLIDRELDIHYKAVLNEENKHEKSALKEYHYLGTNLHGPSRHFTKEGQLLSEVWYLFGKRAGKARFYNKAGRLLSVQKFKEDRWEGEQKYWYPTGGMKTKLTYSQGKLEGVAKLYHRNGKLKRRLHFKEGMRDGLEEIWDREGTRTVEVSYRKGEAVGSARQWNAKGQLIKEVHYADNGALLEEKRWNEKGVRLPPEKSEPYPDYFDLLKTKADHLTDSLKTLVIPFAHLATGDGQMKKDVEELKQHYRQCEKLKKKMEKELKFDKAHPKEPIWRSRQAELEVGEQVEHLVGDLEEQTSSLSDKLEQLKKLFKEKKSHDE